MCSEQKGSSGLNVKEEAELYDLARERLKTVLETTTNVTLIKKVIASKILVEEAIDRLIELALPDDGNGSSEALLELMILTESSKNVGKKVQGRMSWATGDK